MNLNKTIPVKPVALIRGGGIRRSLLLVAYLLCGWFVSFAQTDGSPRKERKRSVYAELFGASEVFGISFESRDIPFSKRLGYRVGLSYFGFTSEQSNLSEVKDGLGVPLEVNYLIGKMEKRSKFEVGLGVNMGGHKREYWRYVGNKQEEGADTEYQDWRRNYALTKTFSFTCFLFATIGYRFQAWNGFQLRTGVTPSVGLSKYNTKDGVYLSPYLSLGYAF